MRIPFEKVKSGRLVCVLGKDITLDMVMALNKRALVGKFEYIKLSTLEILAWVREQWKPLIKKILQVLLLVNGWIISQFLFEEDKKVIRENVWVID